MKKNLSEKQLLKKLGISDFTQIREENLPEFTALLSQVHPEVAKKALEQFPNFSQMALGVVSEYKEIVLRGFEEGGSSVQSYYTACNRILDTLQKELERGFLTSRKREKIIDKMLEVANMMDNKDREHKGFILRMMTTVGGIFMGIVSVAVLILSLGKIKIHK